MEIYFDGGWRGLQPRIALFEQCGPQGWDCGPHTPEVGDVFVLPYDARGYSNPIEYYQRLLPNGLTFSHTGEGGWRVTAI